MAFHGKRFDIFGSFKRKADAVEREEEHSGAFIREIRVKRGKQKGQKRFVVLRERKR